MSFDLANWHAIEVLWTVFALIGLGFAVFNLRRSYNEKDVSDPGTPERIYAIGAIIRDWGRVGAQIGGAALGVFSGFFNSRDPSVFGSLVFFVYIALYTVGSVSDALVRVIITRQPRHETQHQKDDREAGDIRRQEDIDAVRE